MSRRGIVVRLSVEGDEPSHRDSDPAGEDLRPLRRPIESTVDLLVSSKLMGIFVALAGTINLTVEIISRLV